MELFSIASVIIVLSALFGYINVKFLKLPNTIGMMIVAIAFTLVLLASSFVTDYFLETAERLIAQIDFSTVLLQVMLGFLLFAGAMHTNAFATIGVTLSTFLIAIISYFVFGWIGLQVDFIHCLLFGALISPTDPIAVLGILKKARVPKQLETKIVGESLFNDGVGVVVFLTILSIASGGSPHAAHEDEPQTSTAEQSLENETGQSTENEQDTASVADDRSGPALKHDDPSDPSDPSETPGHGGEITVASVILLFLQEVLGGILFGLILGYVTYRMLRSIDNYEIEVIITVACVMGGYSLATALHLSAPLAIVVAGLMVGNDTMRGTSMSAQTEEYVNQFWELMDMLMNAILFVLIGLELLILTIEPSYLLATGLAIVIVLASRFVSLLAPVSFFRKRLDFAPHTTSLMTWGGLRGGISIALALSLPSDMNRDLFLTITYGVVVFSIIVQGLTVGKLASKLIPGSRQ